MSEDVVTIELNPRERRLYDRVRFAVSRLEPGSSIGLRDVILLMPDLTVLLLRLMRDRRVPLGAKAVALVGVGYVLSPIDLVPGFLFGPFGLMDDVIVLSATLSRVVNHVHPDVVRSHWSGQGDALDAIQRESFELQKHFSQCLCESIDELPPARQLVVFKQIQKFLASPATAKDIQAQVMGGAMRKILFVKRLVLGLRFHLPGIDQPQANQFGFHYLTDFPSILIKGFSRCQHPDCCFMDI